MRNWWKSKKRIHIKLGRFKNMKKYTLYYNNLALMMHSFNYRPPCLGNIFNKTYWRSISNIEHNESKWSLLLWVRIYLPTDTTESRWVKSSSYNYLIFSCFKFLSKMLKLYHQLFSWWKIFLLLKLLFLFQNKTSKLLIDKKQ